MSVWHYNSLKYRITILICQVTFAPVLVPVLRKPLLVALGLDACGA